MRRSAIAMTCALLVATLLSPGVAMAKGGNGRHSLATPSASDHGKANAGKGKTQKADPGKKPGTSTKPKAATSQQGTTAKVVEKPKREAPRPTAAGKTERPTPEVPRPAAAEKPQSTIHEPQAGATPPTMAVPGSPPLMDLAEGRISADPVGAAGIETRGVLDTIRLKVNASLEGIRATAARMWSECTSWFGD
jgi:hypothetical protein